MSIPRQFTVAFGIHFLCTLILQSRQATDARRGRRRRVAVTFTAVTLFDETFEKSLANVAFRGRAVAVHVEAVRQDGRQITARERQSFAEFRGFLRHGETLAVCRWKSAGGEWQRIRSMRGKCHPATLIASDQFFAG